MGPPVGIGSADQPVLQRRVGVKGLPERSASGAEGCEDTERSTSGAESRSTLDARLELRHSAPAQRAQAIPKRLGVGVPAATGRANGVSWPQEGAERPELSISSGWALDLSPIRANRGY